MTFSETIIQTEQGPRALADVRVGDLVLGHSGELRRVLSRATRPYTGRIATLRTDHEGDEGVLVAAEQPVLIAHPAYAKRRRLCWIEAARISRPVLSGGIAPVSVLASYDADDGEVEMIDLMMLDVERDHSILTESGIVLYAGG